ncbi:MAG: polymer-forming cytoskeletal protein [Phycisphaerae bacterium]|nr:polymer-forming cytoskeletal protein [Phycisphaerae bacterium]
MAADPQGPGSDAGGRRIVCYRCGRELRVSGKALSVFCPHCQQRLVLENIRISGLCPTREVLTCGDIVVEQGAQLHVHRIWAQNIIVRGRVVGPVTARGSVEVTRSGRIDGNVAAASVVVRDGGIVKGQCRIVRGSPPPAIAPPTGQSSAAVRPSDPPRSASPPAQSLGAPPLRLRRPPLKPPGS